MQAASLRARDCYLEVTVISPQYDPDVAAKVRRLLPEVLAVHQDYPELPREATVARRGLAPQELFALYYKTRHGTVPDAALLDAFARLLETATAPGGGG